MGRAKTSRGHSGSSIARLRSLRPGAAVKRHDPTVTLRDPKFVRRAVIQAMEEGDYDAVVEICRAHLRVLNRTRAAAALRLSRQQVHRLLKPNMTPTLETFTAFMHLLSVEKQRPELAAA